MSFLWFLVLFYILCGIFKMDVSMFLAIYLVGFIFVGILTDEKGR